MSSFEPTIQAYRVGLGRDLLWARFYLRKRQWRHLWRTLKRMARSGVTRRSWWGLWQSEADGMLRARRGLTAASAERRMLRDLQRLQSRSDRRSTR